MNTIKTNGSRIKLGLKMKRNYRLVFVAAMWLCYIPIFGQLEYECPETEGIVIQSWREEILDSYYLGSTPSGSTMRYCENFFSYDYGGSYTLEYIDQGGTGMDAYPNIIIGSAKISGTWQPGNQEITGMPVQLENIPENMFLEWKVSQENALDDDDKWMASINFIFDIYGTETSEPITAQRDYDLVIKSVSHNFTGDELVDKPEPIGNSPAFWFFAREANGDIKPYNLEIDGVVYSYAVRYKFFEGTENKDDKAHVKFIPYGANGAPEVLVVNIKDIIDASKDYIEFANLPVDQYNLANEKIALGDTWLKSINAGYEVYTGESILKTEKFQVYQDESLSLNDMAKVAQISCYPNPVSEKLYVNFNGFLGSKMEVYDLTGKKVKEVMYSGGQMTLDFQSFQQGIYYLKILGINQSNQLVKKIVVQ